MGEPQLEYKWPDEIDGCRLVRTCRRFGEAYDVCKNEKLLGWMRVRYGRFYATYADGTDDGVVVFHTVTKGGGEFDDDEREPMLKAAINALLIRHELGER